MFYETVRSHLTGALEPHNAFIMALFMTLFILFMDCIGAWEYGDAGGKRLEWKKDRKNKMSFEKWQITLSHM